MITTLTKGYEPGSGTGRSLLEVLFWPVIIAVSLVPRIYFLLTTERFLDMDESVIGVMVKRVAEKGEVYFYFAGAD